MKHFTPIFQDDILIDVETNINERPVRVLGKAGAAREQAILAPLKKYESLDNILPVLLGAGLGHALKALLAITKGPIAVVEKESELFTLSEMRKKYPDPRIFWVIAPEAAPPKAILKTLVMWQIRHEDKPFALLVHPFYQRLDSWYQEMRQNINTSNPHLQVWKNARQPRFTTSSPRILMLCSDLFFLGDIIAALNECQYEYEILNLKAYMEDNQTIYMSKLLQTVTNYRPDYMLTISNSGMDLVGIVTDMLERMQIPLASWFLDNPLADFACPNSNELIQSPWYTLFTWDADGVSPLKDLGYKHIFHLPLGTNPKRFYPRPKNEQLCSAVCRDITFVGNSAVDRMSLCHSTLLCPTQLLKNYQEIAKAFSISHEYSVDTFLRNYDSTLVSIYDSLSIFQRQLYSTFITWSATQYYRASCIKAILPFNPLIIGDKGWLLSLEHAPEAWEYKRNISYQRELHLVYPYSTINFNCTSRQMKGAVNQRIFDVPAAGSFTLTDWQEQMDDLLERDKEIIAYHEIEEIPELVRFYLKNDTARKTIITAGRKRVLGEHTWAHRLRYMTETMKDIYGS